jgi:Protein of unknown function (DUF2281)
MEQLILSEIYQLPEHLKLEVLHFTQFLKKEFVQNTSVSSKKIKRVFGSAKGKYSMTADFDAPLDDFKDYM